VRGVGVRQDLADVRGAHARRYVEFDPVGVDFHPDRGARGLPEQRGDHAPDRLVRPMAGGDVDHDRPTRRLDHEPLVGRDRVALRDTLLDRIECLRDRRRIGGIAPCEVAGDGVAIPSGLELARGHAAGLADFPGHCVRHWNLPAGPGGHLATGVLHRRCVDAGLLLVDLGDPPEFAALDERGPRLREVDDEPLIEGADALAGRHVVHLVGLLVGDHREMAIEVLPGPPALLDPVGVLL